MKGFAIVLAIVCAWMLVGADSCSTDTSSTGSPPAQVSDAATSTQSPAPTPTTAPTAPPTQASTPAPTQAPAPTGCYKDPAGNCYRAGQYCPTSLYGQTVQGASGPIKCVNNNGWRWENA